MDKGHNTQSSMSFFERSLGKLLLLCVMVSSLLTFLLIPLADNSSRLNSRQVFDSSRWHSLQLQLQTYRLMDYLSGITERDLPLQGNAYFQYDLVLSRVDLLRKGDLGRHIRSFANGRATRLLNIISGELELISLNIEHLEQGQLEHVPILVERLRALDSQITDFVVIVNQSANDYVTGKRDELDSQLEYIQIISMVLLILATTLLLITFKLSKKLERTFKHNLSLAKKVKDVQAAKFEIVRRISSELKPSLSGTLNSSASLLQQSMSEDLRIALERITNNHQQMLTQLDCYHDLTLIEADQLQPQLSQGSLRQHLNHSVESLVQTMSTYRMRVLCGVDPSLVDQVETDFNRLHEILVTLLNHIAPYCQGADVLIQLRPSTLPVMNFPKRSRQGTLRMVQISIRDNGEGLPESVQDGLRNNPHNPNNTVMNQIQLMGMGFTFCHFLISALHGELHFTSSKDKGSEIWIDLPMVVGGAQDGAIEHTTIHEDTHIAVLETGGLLDQALINALQPFVSKVSSVTESQLNDYLMHTEELPFKALFINQLLPLSIEQRDCCMGLQEKGVELILPKPLSQAHPELVFVRHFQYPITSAQLQKILG